MNHDRLYARIMHVQWRRAINRRRTAAIASSPGWRALIQDHTMPPRPPGPVENLMPGAMGREKAR